MFFLLRVLPLHHSCHVCIFISVLVSLGSLGSCTIYHQQNAFIPKAPKYSANTFNWILLIRTEKLIKRISGLTCSRCLSLSHDGAHVGISILFEGKVAHFKYIWLSFFPLMWLSVCFLRAYILFEFMLPCCNHVSGGAWNKPYGIDKKKNHSIVNNKTQSYFPVCNHEIEKPLEKIWWRRILYLFTKGSSKLLLNCIMISFWGWYKYIKMWFSSS